MKQNKGRNGDFQKKNNDQSYNTSRVSNDAGDPVRYLIDDSNFQSGHSVSINSHQNGQNTNFMAQKRQIQKGNIEETLIKLNEMNKLNLDVFGNSRNAASR